MHSIDHFTALTRLTLVLQLIVQRWPEISAQTLLSCARKLPGIIMALPLPALLNERAAELYIQELSDSGEVPPWVG